LIKKIRPGTPFGDAAAAFRQGVPHPEMAIYFAVIIRSSLSEGFFHLSKPAHRALAGA
jgi:hypothetical protein